MSAGDVLDVMVHNALPEATTVHWHGLALRNDMDGVPGITQTPIRAGTTMRYRFVAPDPGTYWFHPHVGTQQDRGRYSPLIVEHPDEPGQYDVEYTVVLDDWVDGTGVTPPEILAALLAEDMKMPGMGGESDGDYPMSLLGEDAGDVRYPLYLINGRSPQDPVTFTGQPAQTVRFRIINAASDTAFRVALAGHRLTVTHTDGFPVDPVEGDAVSIGMGQRFDVQVRLQAGIFPLVALADGKGDAARAIVRTGVGAPPSPGQLPTELVGLVLTADQLTAKNQRPCRTRPSTVATTSRWEVR